MDNPNKGFFDDKVYFSWEICYTCNYRCPYCGRWNDASRDDLLLGVESWEKIWRNIYKEYGSCDMFISGAEPTTYLNFFDIVRNITTQHNVTLCTNFSWDVKEILDRDFDPRRLQFTPTFHSLFADFESFLGKAVHLKPWIRDNMVFFVAYPSQMSKVDYYKKRMNEHGINFSIVPLRGSNHGHLEVTSSPEDKARISSITDMHEEEFDYLAQNISPEGKPCRAGYRYAIIKPNGMVFPCSQNNQSLGSIVNGNFALLKEPTVCASQFCPYESYNLLERHGVSVEGRDI